MIPSDIGILLTNIGTPASPTVPAVREYLKQFLSDPRVIKVPSFLWKPILYGLILPFRSKRSALYYKQIWGKEGSPLLHYSSKIAEKLEKQLQIPVAIGMHYSKPTIKDAFKKLHSEQVNKIIVLPLYPQYSGTTTESTVDKISALQMEFKNSAFHTVRSYSNDLEYILTLEQSIRQAWNQFGQAAHLLFSFHGIPTRYIALGDHYADLCYETVSEITQRLGMHKNDYTIAFQSRFSRYGWLEPHTEQVLQNLPKNGITDLQVICPGFAVDCLETLEEIAIRGKMQYINAGGKSFRYISALNDSDGHINMLSKIVIKTANKIFSNGGFQSHLTIQLPDETV